MRKSPDEPSYVTKACLRALNALKHKATKNNSHESVFKFLVLHLQFCLNLARKIALDDTYILSYGFSLVDARKSRNQFTQLVDKLWFHADHPDLTYILPSDTIDVDEYILCLEVNGCIDSPDLCYEIADANSANSTELFKICQYSIDHFVLRVNWCLCHLSFNFSIIKEFAHSLITFL